MNALRWSVALLSTVCRVGAKRGETPPSFEVSKRFLQFSQDGHSAFFARPFVSARIFLFARDTPDARQTLDLHQAFSRQESFQGLCRAM
jgi:hypothetical protein